MRLPCPQPLPLLALRGLSGSRCANLDDLDHLRLDDTLGIRQSDAFFKTLADLAGGDRQANAEIVRRLLRGQDRGPKRDAVLLNCAAALFVAEKAKSLTEGWELAAELLDSGRALAKLEQLARVWK